MKTQLTSTLRLKRGDFCKNVISANFACTFIPFFQKSFHIKFAYLEDQHDLVGGILAKHVILSLNTNERVQRLIQLFTIITG